VNGNESARGGRLLTHKKFGISSSDVMDPILGGEDRGFILGILNDLLCQLLGSLRGHDRGVGEWGDQGTTEGKMKREDGAVYKGSQARPGDIISSSTGRSVHRFSRESVTGHILDVRNLSVD